MIILLLPVRSPLQPILDQGDGATLVNLPVDVELWNVIGPQPWPVPPIQVITDDEVWPAQPLTITVDESYWLGMAPILYPPLPIIIQDDEALPNAKYFPIDEDSYQASGQFSQSIIRQTIADTDELVPVGLPTIIEEEVCARLIPILQTWAAPQLITDLEELALLGLDEEPWTSPLLSNPIFVRQPIVEDLSVVPTMVEDDQWRAPALHRLGNTLTPVWDVEIASASGITIRLVQLFAVRCAKTKLATVSCAKTKTLPVPVA